MNISHFMSKTQLDTLFVAIAKPTEFGGEIKWVAPHWWHVMYFFARS